MIPKKVLAIVAMGAVLVLSGCSKDKKDEAGNKVTEQTKADFPTVDEARNCYSELENEGVLWREVVSYIRNGDMSVTKFEKNDGVSNGSSSYKLIVDMEVKANKDLGTFCYKNGVKQDDYCTYKEGEAYQYKAYLDFQKSEKGWRSGDCLIPR